MPEIVPFTKDHILSSIELWRSTEYIGLNDLDDREDRIASFLERNVGCSFVAVERSNLVGACLCGHDARRGYIYHLAVDKSCRRAGIATKLVASALGGLAAAGIAKCHIHVFVDNPNGAAFWATEGWQHRTDLNSYSIYTSPSSIAR